MLDPDRPEGEALARVCVEKLGGYLRDEGGDQNRKFRLACFHDTRSNCSTIYCSFGNGKNHPNASSHDLRVSRRDFAELG